MNVKSKEKSAPPLPDNHAVTDRSRDGRHLLTTAHDVEEKVPTGRLHLRNRDGTQAQALTDVSQFAWRGNR